MLTAAASMAPVPEAVRIKISFFVWKTSLRPSNHFDDHLLGLGRTMVDDRPGQLEKNVFRNHGGPGSHESRLSHQQFPSISSRYKRGFQSSPENQIGRASLWFDLSISLIRPTPSAGSEIVGRAAAGATLSTRRPENGTFLYDWMGKTRLQLQLCLSSPRERLRNPSRSCFGLTKSEESGQSESITSVGEEAGDVQVVRRGYLPGFHRAGLLS